MIRRNLGSAACLKPFSPKESAAFFREIAKHKAAAPKGRLQWTTIRGTLVQRLTDQKVTSFKASVSGKSKPLGVWLQKGYRKEIVEGCPNYWCPDIKEQVYQVPVKEVKWSEEHSKIEAQILQHEQEAAKKKASGKRKAKDDASSDGELDLPEAATVEKKEPNVAVKKKKVLAANTALSNYAARSLGPLQKSITCLTKTVDKVNQASCQMEDEVQKTLAEITTKLEDWAAAARRTVNAHESTREMWKQEDADLPSLDKLPFDSGDLKAGLKQATELQDLLKQLLPVKEPKAKAKAKAKSEAKAADADGQPCKRRQVKGAWGIHMAAPLHCVDKRSCSQRSIGPFCPT